MRMSKYFLYLCKQKQTCTSTGKSMIDNNKKGCCGKTKRWIPIAIGTLAVLLVAVVVTKDLPWQRGYETRYEFKVRNFRKSVEGPFQMLGCLAVRDSYWMCRYVDSLPDPEGLTHTVRYDNTEKITLLVKGTDSTAVADYAAALYKTAYDTVTKYGDEVSQRKAVVLRDIIDELHNTMDDSILSLRNSLYERLATVETDLAVENKYVDLLNGAEVPGAQKTPSRGWVIVLSVVVAFLFCLTVSILKKREDDESC